MVARKDDSSEGRLPTKDEVINDLQRENARLRDILPPEPPSLVPVAPGVYRCLTNIKWGKWGEVGVGSFVRFPDNHPDVLDYLAENAIEVAMCREDESVKVVDLKLDEFGLPARYTEDD